MSRLWDQFPKGNFWIAFFLMWLVLGVLVGSALKTQHRVQSQGLPTTRFPELASQYKRDKSTLNSLQEEIKQLLEKNTALENALASGTKQAKVLNDNLQEAKMLAGLVEVEGSGVEVILQDSKKQVSKDTEEPMLADIYTIHDYDILRVVNELKQAGAEAISVNGQRVIGSTAIRCTGPIIYVNDIKLSSPFVIQAVGDPNTLLGALKMPGGVLEDIENADPKMVQINTKEKVVIPAFAGSTKFRFAKPAPPKEDSN